METETLANFSSSEPHPGFIIKPTPSGRSRHFFRWILFAPLGMCLVGLGLCLFAEAHDIRATGTDFANWFWLGTLSLVVVNSGLAFIGEAVKSRVMMELRKKRRSQSA